MIKVDNQLFSLHTRHTSYLFRVMETGHLEHLYYGRKIHSAIDGLTEQHAFAPGNTNIYDSRHPEFSLEDVCLEMSSFGKGDIREPERMNLRRSRDRMMKRAKWSGFV